MGRGARRPASARYAPPEPRKDYKGPHTVFFTNLGMLGMNVGLDVRVVDQIGLANPLAAHTSRLVDGRIGHDKNLFPDWAVAEGPFLKTPPFIPAYVDQDWMAQAEAALKCPATDAMLTVGARSDGVAAVHVKPVPRVRVHAVSDQSGAAVRTQPLRSGSACTDRRPLHWPAGDGAVM